MSAHDKTGPAIGETRRDEASRLAQDIEATRATMTGALTALETRLSPAEMRSKVDVELQHVEDKLRGVVREQLADAKALVKEELSEAQTLLRQEMNEAETKIRKGLVDARDTVKKDIREAITGAQQSVRAATFGKVEDLATSIGDTMNDTRDTLVETIRQNPLPAALAGIGLAWLFMNRSSSARRTSARGPHFVDGLPYTYDVQTRSRNHGGDPLVAGVNGAQRVVGRAVDQLGRAVHGATDAAGNAVHQASGATSEALHQASDAASGALHQASDVASGALHQASDAASSMAHQVSDKASSFAHGVSDASANLVHGAGDAAASMVDGARGQVQRVERGFQETLQNNPLAIGAAAVAVGAVRSASHCRARSEKTRSWAKPGTVSCARPATPPRTPWAAVGMVTEQAGTSAKSLLTPGEPTEPKKEELPITFGA